MERRPDTSRRVPYTLVNPWTWMQATAKQTFSTYRTMICCMYATLSVTYMQLLTIKSYRKRFLLFVPCCCELHIYSIALQ